MKDALKEMLIAISEILSDDLEAFEFHITGLQESK